MKTSSTPSVLQNRWKHIWHKEGSCLTFLHLHPQTTLITSNALTAHDASTSMPQSGTFQSVPTMYSINQNNHKEAKEYRVKVWYPGNVDMETVFFNMLMKRIITHTTFLETTIYIVNSEYNFNILAFIISSLRLHAIADWCLIYETYVLTRESYSLYRQMYYFTYKIF